MSYICMVLYMCVMYKLSKDSKILVVGFVNP